MLAVGSGGCASSSSQSRSCAASSTIIEICAHAEVLAFVGHDKRLVVSLRFFECGEEHRDRVLTERVHLRVELQAEHAIADVDERGSGLDLTSLRARLWIARRFMPGRGFEFVVAGVDEIEIAGPRSSCL